MAGLGWRCWKGMGGPVEARFLKHGTLNIGRIKREANAAIAHRTSGGGGRRCDKGRSRWGRRHSSKHAAFVAGGQGSVLYQLLWMTLSESRAAPSGEAATALSGSRQVYSQTPFQTNDSDAFVFGEKLSPRESRRQHQIYTASEGEVLRLPPSWWQCIGRCSREG